MLERLRERAVESQRQGTSGGSGFEALLEWARGLLRPTPLRHAIAALRRGNQDAAFALLREEVTARPDRAESTRLFWEVAQSCERPRDAAEPLARYLQREVSEGRLEEAAELWVALVGLVPEARIEVAALVRILPELRVRITRARGEVAQRQARERFGDALRRSVESESGGLAPALALRIVDEARGVDLEVAKRAARAALASSSLHEAKRGKLEELLRALERGEWPDAAVESPASARPAAAPRAATAPRATPAARPGAPRPRAVPRPTPASRPVAVPQPASAPRPKPDAAQPTAATRATAAHPLSEPDVPSGSPGRRSVALSADEIEAASMRLAERMAARSAAAALEASDASELAPREPAVAAPVETEPEALEEPIAEALAAQDPVDAEPQYLSDLDAESAFGPPLEVDAEVLSAQTLEAPIEAADLSLGEDELSIEVGDAVPLDDDDDALPVESGDAAGSDDFEFGSAALEPEASAAVLESAADADFEFGASEAEPLAESEASREEMAPAASAASRRALEITPVELGEDGLVAWEVAHERRTRVDYRAVEFLAAAEVEGLGDEPVFLVDLILRARAGRPRSALRMRSDAFDAAALYPDRTDAGQALRALLSDLLERTRAIPLPDPDSALGVRPQRFASVAEFEAATSKRFSG